MIASVRGTVLASSGSVAIIEVGGIGLQVALTPAHALELRVGREVSIPTALIVREDELALYGFADVEGRELFDLLRGVSGVGPKSAMAILGAMSATEIANAVVLEDDGAFRKVSGIGPKTAKLIIVSLTGKVHASPNTSRSGPTISTVSSNVVAALVSLGWSERAAISAVDEVVASATDSERESVPTLLRYALSQLGSGMTQGSANGH